MVINMSCPPLPKIPSPSPAAGCGHLQPAPATASLVPGGPQGPPAGPPAIPPHRLWHLQTHRHSPHHCAVPPIPPCHPPTPKLTPSCGMNSSRFNIPGASAWGIKHNTFFPFFGRSGVVNLYLGSYLLILSLIPQTPSPKKKSPILHRPEMRPAGAGPGSTQRPATVRRGPWAPWVQRSR